MRTQDQIEMWAGLESTINRVQDTWFDQCERNGHGTRIEDIDLFASLGISKLRYPVLWEKAQVSEGQFDFSWAEPRLQKLGSYGIEPIATLLQHGSGPEDTSLVDPEFPEKFARYARAVAEKFPQLRMYTPVNEPLTTARFSGLYGVWYPHGRSYRVMLRALLNECRGTILAMREIKKVNPRALLVQTEDMGRATGTAPCEKEVAFQNQRRWLSLDLLCGRIDKSHPLRSWMLKHAVRAEELDWFLKNSTPPDIIGINHYLLSNRFIDHRRDLYPRHFRGQHAGLRYADLGTIQVTEHHPAQKWAPLVTPLEVYRDVCERYDIPMAVTEVQIAGARESQMQWLKEIWNAANQLQTEGHKIVAVTPWSLLGSYDWNSLCSKNGGFYESGVFDVRAPTPRPTAVARMIQDLATFGDTHHPVLENLGFWHRQPPAGTPILITGADGGLGLAFARIAEARGLSYVLVSRAQMDSTSLTSVRDVLKKANPWAVINTAGYVRVDEAEAEPNRAFMENVIGCEILAYECELKKIPYLTFSTDLVFDGSKEINNPKEPTPYLEGDVPSPLNVYGQTKVEMEKRVLGIHPKALVVRTSSFFSPWDQTNFAARVLHNLHHNKPIDVALDVVMAPTYVPDLVDVCLNLLIDGVSGLTHLANRGEVSWAEFAREVASLFDLNHQLIRPKHRHDLKWLASRPHYSALSSERFQMMAPLQESLDRFRYDLRNVGPIVGVA